METSIDIILAGAIFVCTWRLAYLGVHVTLHPPDTPEGKSRKRVKCEFYGLALLSTVLIGIQVYRANQTYSELLSAVRKNQSPEIVVGKMGLDQPIQILMPNQDFLVGMSFLVSEGVAKAMHCEIYAFDLPGAASQEQNREAMKKMRVKIAEEGEVLGTNITAGQRCLPRLESKIQPRPDFRINKYRAKGRSKNNLSHGSCWMEK